LVIDDDAINCRVAQSIGCYAIRFDPTDAVATWATALAARPTME